MNIGEELGLSREDIADALGWCKEMREIGPENYMVNPPMEEFFREKLSVKEKPLD
ncbi:MAG TPA: hypothetical protein VFP46_00060 [Candidatus Paceibacterota bacterium]|nr:hypothetical protein [Candidatus Paceibacterota bacterium]